MFMDWKTQLNKDVNFSPNWYIALTYFLSTSQDDWFLDTDDYSKILMECNGTRIAKMILKKKTKVGEISLIVKNYYVAMSNKTAWWLWRDRPKDLRNRTESQEVDSHRSARVIFDKGEKNDSREDGWPSHKWC